jgi:hypothetical protein
MREIATKMFLGMTLLLAGCVPSLKPLYTEKDLVFEPGLVGVWAEKEDSEETWAFEKSGEKAYKLIYTQDGKTGEFKVHLLKLGDTLFLDLYPDDEGLARLNRNDFYWSHWLPTHTFAKVRQIEPTLQMSFLNGDWLEKSVEKNPKAIRHERIDGDRIVLTASTKELQEFVNKHSKQAFGESEPSNLKRIKPRPASAPKAPK